MTDNAAKRRAIADKLAADIPRLTDEVARRRAAMVKAKARAMAMPHKSTLTAGWFDAWSRHIGPLIRAERSLARAKNRAPAALIEAEDAEFRARQAVALKRRIEAANVGLMKRLDALAAAAPAVSKQWREDRAGEEKRLKKMRRAIERRTSKDRTDRPDWMKKPMTLPPPVEQPDFSVDDVDTIDPPREGLIPGTYRVVDPDRLGLLNPKPLPIRWTWQHVGERLIEAHAVIGRLPATIWPKGYGAAWPAYRHEFGEMAIQAGAGTLAVGRNVLVRTASADEVARSNEAIQWPMQFLSGVQWAAEAVNTWAMRDDADPELNGPQDHLQYIADALNAANEVVR